MIGSTLIIEMHGYRGFSRAGGPLGSALTLGFVTVTWMPVLLTDWLRDKLARLKNISGDSRGFVEMAAWDGDPVQRINHGKPLHVPSGGKK